MALNQLYKGQLFNRVTTAEINQAQNHFTVVDTQRPGSRGFVGAKDTWIDNDWSYTGERTGPKDFLDFKLTSNLNGWRRREHVKEIREATAFARARLETLKSGGVPADLKTVADSYGVSFGAAKQCDPATSHTIEFGVYAADGSYLGDVYSDSSSPSAVSFMTANLLERDNSFVPQMVGGDSFASVVAGRNEYYGRSGEAPISATFDSTTATITAADGAVVDLKMFQGQPVESMVMRATNIVGRFEIGMELADGTFVSQHVQIEDGSRTIGSPCSHGHQPTVLDAAGNVTYQTRPEN